MLVVCSRARRRFQLIHHNPLTLKLDRSRRALYFDCIWRKVTCIETYIRTPRGETRLPRVRATNFNLEMTHLGQNRSTVYDASDRVRPDFREKFNGLWSRYLREFDSASRLHRPEHVDS